MKLRNLSIAAKINLAFAMMFIVVGALGATTIDRLGAIHAVMEDIDNNWLPSVGTSSDMISHAKQYRIYEGQLLSPLIASDQKERIAVKEKLKEAAAAVAKYRAIYDPMIVKGTDGEKFTKEFDETWADYQQWSARTIAASDANDTTTAEMLFGESYQAFFKAIDAVEHGSDSNQAEGKKAAGHAEDIYTLTHRVVVAVIGTAALLCFITGWLIIKNVSKPLKALTEVMVRLSKHDLTVGIVGVGRGDELGAMAKTVEIFKDSMIETDRLQAEQEEMKKRAEQEKRAMMHKLANDFESGVQGIISTVASASTELCHTADNMKDIVTTVNSESGGAASASQQTSGNVQSVASAVEEMSASIKEIASQVAKSSTMVSEAVAKTTHADSIIQTLAEAVSQIGGISDLIQNIAGQINLLALNATIESARAGDAGKGFAVVASEVKNLAGQTSKATDEIARQIENVRNVSAEVAKALKAIQDAINNVNHSSSSIASAIEEQSSVTREISSNMQQAARGVQSISSSISSITKGAADADAGAAEVLTAANMLSQQSEKLNSEVKSFLASIRG